MMAGFLTALGSSLVLAGLAPAPIDGPEPEPEHARSEAGAGLIELDYLRRPVARSARFLDHGVILARAAGGTPHRYRLELQVGLFDHVSVGVTAHWLPGQRAPQVWPIGSIALWRWLGPNGVGVNLGAHYRPVLFAPVDPELRYVPQAHFGLGTIEVSAGWFSAGLDVGAAHNRFAVLDPEDPLSFRRRAVFGGGVFARAGNRRYGLTFDALAALGPEVLMVFELGLDVRFGAFEERGRGDWAWGS